MTASSTKRRQSFNMGMTRHLSDEERAANRRASALRYRKKNLLAVREAQAKRACEIRAEKASQEGRVLKAGAPKIYTDEERRIRAMTRSLKYWEKNPEKRKVLAHQYYEQNKEAHTLRVHNRRAVIRGGHSAHTAADVELILAEQGEKCALCFNPLSDAVPHVDHWMPVKLGGSNGPENLTIMHGRCNRKKGAKHPLTLTFIPSHMAA